MAHIFADKTGGAKLNEGVYTAASDYPAWATRWDQDCWRERGVVIWDEATQRLERLWASQVLKLLEAARADDSWRTIGIPITREGTWLPLPKKPPRKRARKKHEQTVSSAREEQTQAPRTEPKTVVEERFRLTASASVELVGFLSVHELKLKEIAEEDQREASRVLGEIYDNLARLGRGMELTELDLASRLLSWRLESDAQELICEAPPNRGTVMYDDTLLSWCGCVERPECFQDTSPLFARVEEAIDWVEQAVVKPAPRAEDDEAAPPFELTPAVMERLQPFWITPELLEPGRITYRVLIELEHQPVSFKTGEMSFGKKYQYDKKYLDAYSLGRELNLSPERLEVEHLEYIGFYRVKSLVKYPDERLALMQAQQLWEQSSILEHYKSGQVIHARYGLQEMETGYLRVAGVCCSAEDQWAIPQTRAEYMAKEALEYTLAHALDVNAYRAHAGFRRRWLSDDDLLYMMHRRRAKCSAIPVETCRESEAWLLGHPDDLRHD